MTPDRWNGYLLHLAANGTKSNTQHRQLVSVRQVLRRYPHRLHPDLPKHLNRRLPKRDADESQPYSRDEYAATLKAATAAVNAEYQRIHPNLLMLRRRGSTKLSPEQRARADASHEIATAGAPLSDATRNSLGIKISDRRYSGVNAARPMLFVSQEGAVAIAVLIACLEGANFTPINERKVRRPLRVSVSARTFGVSRTKSAGDTITRMTYMPYRRMRAARWQKSCR